jgi:hypothetical protein
MKKRLIAAFWETVLHSLLPVVAVRRRRATLTAPAPGQCVNGDMFPTIILGCVRGDDARISTKVFTRWSKR